MPNTTPIEDRLQLLLPGGFAVKVLQVLAISAVPYGVWRGMAILDTRRSSRVWATLAVAVGMTYPQRYPVGGDLWSTVIGEYSYTLAAGLGIWLLCAVYGLVRGRIGWRSVALLAAATLCTHANVAFVVAPGALLVAGVGAWQNGAGGRTRALAHGALAAVTAAGLSAFWLLPMRSMHAEVQGNNKLADRSLWFWFHDPMWRGIAVIGGIGLVVGMVRRRSSAWVFAAVGVAAAGLYETLTVYTSFELWSGRCMPFVYLALLVGVGEAAEGVVAMFRRRQAFVAAVVVAAVLGAGVYGHVDTDQRFDGAIGERIAHTWAGVGRGDTAAAARGDELVALLDSLEPGRLLYTHGGESYKTYGAQDLNGELQRRIDDPAYGGASTFFHEANRGRYPLAYAYSGVSTSGMRIEPGGTELGIDDFASAIEMLRQFGVRYYITGQTDLAEVASTTPTLRRVGSVGARASGDDQFFEVYEIQSAGIVEAVTREPGVVEVLALWGETTWDGKVKAWMRRLGVEPYTGVHLVETAPIDLDWIGQKTYPSVTISDVEITDERIAFRVDRVGVPVLVRMGYAPQWQAAGATGPYHAAPNSMIVVPTEHDVVVAFHHPFTERAGLLISFGTAGWLAVAALRRRRNGGSGTATKSSVRPEQVSLGRQRPARTRRGHDFVDTPGASAGVPSDVSPVE